MKKYIYSLIALFMVTLCSAQMFISQAEYFWDNDPGAGNGTAILATDGTFNSAFEQLTRTGITLPSNGLHKFNVRIKDNTGVWGPVFTNIINVQVAPTATIMALTQAEYFWDTDPGEGNGTTVLAADGSFNSTFEQLTQTGIALPAAGLHVFNIRIKDNTGVWGPVFRNVINVQTTPSGCFQKIDAGGAHNFAIKSDGTLWSWGTSGHLGSGSVSNYNAPTQIGTANNWKTVCDAGQHAAGIRTNGTLWTWGYNNSGQLGLGTVGTGVFVPIQVGTATNWKSVAVGFEITLAIKTDGTLWAWGRNSNGALGDGTLNNRSVPAQVGTANNWAELSVSNQVLALKTDGTLWGWGYNGDSVLGNGNTTNVTVPTQIGTATWQKIAAALSHSQGIQTDGSLWAWGNNLYGKLGDGTATNRTVPTRIGTATNWQSIDNHENHSVAIKTDGSLYAWGQNNEGQLGDGTATNRSVPTRIGTANNWQSVSAGGYHSIALKTDGSLYSWGYNSGGQLGNGTSGFTNTFTPTSVACPTSTLAIEEVEVTSQIKMYPNPVKDILNLSFDKEMATVSIYNLLGQEVISKSINTNEGTIDVSSLITGTYFVKVSADGLTKTMKVIKE